MSRRNYILLIAAAVVLALSVGDALGGFVMIGAHNGPRHSVTGSIRIGGPIGPVPGLSLPGFWHHGPAIVRGPHGGRFVPIVPVPPVAVVRPPVVPKIVVPRPVLPKAVFRPAPVPHGKVHVWITNSHGSRRCVTLRRSGRGYVGPRGEWYHGMPTHKQLRAGYDF